MRKSISKFSHILPHYKGVIYLLYRLLCFSNENLWLFFAVLCACHKHSVSFANIGILFIANGFRASLPLISVHSKTQFSKIENFYVTKFLLYPFMVIGFRHLIFGLKIYSFSYKWTSLQNALWFFLLKPLIILMITTILPKTSKIRVKSLYFRWFRGFFASKNDHCFSLVLSFCLFRRMVYICPENMWSSRTPNTASD